MNLFTANALLKLLEEPTTNAQFLLISSSPKRLLPTIRSRCQTWTFPRPPVEQARRWLASRQLPEAEALLAFCGGMPLAAAEMAEGGVGAARARFISDISKLPDKPPMRLAGEWEAWLKSKESVAAGFDLPTLVSWMQRWVADLSALRLGGTLRFFPDCQDTLARLAVRMSLDTALGCYNEVTQSRRVAQHPLNPRLFLEDMLLRYARNLQASATAVRK